ncbi:hypothetical protein L3Y34_007998 [Caenorhabditis briggsae]|nr:hypothetical protein L3Y34_007998 [Caenorhabditis briggsae]
MENQFAAAIITILVFMVGAITNILVLYAAKKLPSMNSSFGIITKNQAVSTTILCFIFIFFAFPWQLELAISFIAYSHYVGIVATTMYHSSIMFHFFLAFNRLCAVFFPLHYKSIFTNFFTLNVMIMLWIIAIIKCTISYGAVGCYFQYYESFWTFSSLSSEFCDSVNWYTDFIPNNSFGVIIVTINLVSGYRVGRNRKSLNPGVQMTKQQRQREIYFVKQTFFQGTSVFAGLVTYYVLAPLFVNEVILFVLSNIWAFMQAAEGVIIFASNREMRSVIRKPKKLYTQMEYLKTYGEFSVPAGTFIMIFERYGAVFFPNSRLTLKYKLWFMGLLCLYLIGLSTSIYLMRICTTSLAQLSAYSINCFLSTVSSVIFVHLYFTSKRQYYKTLGVLQLKERYLLSESYELCQNCFAATFTSLAINTSLFLSFWLFVLGIIPFGFMYPYFLCYDMVLNISATLYPILFICNSKKIKRKIHAMKTGPPQEIEIRQLNGNIINTTQTQEEYFQQLNNCWA